MEEGALGVIYPTVPASGRPMVLFTRVLHPRTPTNLGISSWIPAAPAGCSGKADSIPVVCHQMLEGSQSCGACLGETQTTETTGLEKLEERKTGAMMPA